MVALGPPFSAPLGLDVPRITPRGEPPSAVGAGTEGMGGWEGGRVSGGGRGAGQNGPGCSCGVGSTAGWRTAGTGASRQGPGRRGRAQPARAAGEAEPSPAGLGAAMEVGLGGGGPSGASHRGLKQQRFASHGSGGQMSRAEADRPLAPKAPDLPSASGGCRCDPGWAPSGLRLPAAPPVPLGQRSPTWLVTAAKLSCFQRRPLPGTRCSGAFLF